MFVFTFTSRSVSIDLSPHVCAFLSKALKYLSMVPQISFIVEHEYRVPQSSQVLVWEKEQNENSRLPMRANDCLEKLKQIPTQEIALIMHQEGHHQAPICA
jgi:hypothetical protein